MDEIITAVKGKIDQADKWWDAKSKIYPAGMKFLEGCLIGLFIIIALAVGIGIIVGWVMLLAKGYWILALSIAMVVAIVGCGISTMHGS